MKTALILPTLCLVCATALAAEDGTREERLALHKEHSEKIADEQDELSADVQQLVIEQTQPQVIALLSEVEDIMDETTDRLADADTGGETIAGQTEIIEKIHAAAQQKQCQGGGGKPGSAMMDMLERMMGKKPEGDQKQQGKQPGDQSDQGQTGLSDTGNEAAGGDAGGKGEVRRILKAAGGASPALPEEFQKAYDAYNRGAEQQVK